MASFPKFELRNYWTWLQMTEISDNRKVRRAKLTVQLSSRFHFRDLSKILRNCDATFSNLNPATKYYGKLQIYISIFHISTPLYQFLHYNRIIFTGWCWKFKPKNLKNHFDGFTENHVPNIRCQISLVKKYMRHLILIVSKLLVMSVRRCFAKFVVLDRREVHSHSVDHII